MCAYDTHSTGGCMSSGLVSKKRSTSSLWEIWGGSRTSAWYTKRKWHGTISRDTHDLQITSLSSTVKTSIQDVEDDKVLITSLRQCGQGSAILLAYFIWLARKTENAVPLKSDRWCYTDATFLSTWGWKGKINRPVNIMLGFMSVLATRPK